MASHSGITVFVLLGLVALGAGGDPGCDPPESTTTASEAGDDDFSFEPAPGATVSGVGAGSDGDTGGDAGGDGDDFSFEPAPGATVSGAGAGSAGDAGGDAGGDDAAGDADEDFSFEPQPDAVRSSADGEVSTCDDAAAVETAAGAAEVPVERPLFDDPTVDCTMAEGSGDDEAVVALQRALARCHGQAVDADGSYGPGTARAVLVVEQQLGLDADGRYDLVTGRAMRWPAGDTCAAAIGSSGG